MTEPSYISNQPPVYRITFKYDSDAEKASRILDSCDIKAEIMSQPPRIIFTDTNWTMVKLGCKKVQELLKPVSFDYFDPMQDWSVGFQALSLE